MKYIVFIGLVLLCSCTNSVNKERYNKVYDQIDYSIIEVSETGDTIYRECSLGTEDISKN